MVSEEFNRGIEAAACECDRHIAAFERLAIEIREKLGPRGMSVYLYNMSLAEPYRNAAFKIRGLKRLGQYG